MKARDSRMGKRKIAWVWAKIELFKAMKNASRDQLRNRVPLNFWNDWVKND